MLREELQEECWKWDSQFDKPKKLSGVDWMKASKPITPQQRNRYLESPRKRLNLGRSAKTMVRDLGL